MLAKKSITNLAENSPKLWQIGGKVAQLNGSFLWRKIATTGNSDIFCTHLQRCTSGKLYNFNPVRKTRKMVLLRAKTPKIAAAA